MENHMVLALFSMDNLCFGSVGTRAIPLEGLIGRKVRLRVAIINNHNYCEFVGITSGYVKGVACHIEYINGYYYRVELSLDGIVIPGSDLANPKSIRSELKELKDIHLCPMDVWSFSPSDLGLYKAVMTVI